MIYITNNNHGIKKEGEGALLVGGGETPTAHSKSKHNNGQNNNSDIASEDLARFHTHTQEMECNNDRPAGKKTNTEQNKTKQENARTKPENN